MTNTKKQEAGRRRGQREDLDVALAGPTPAPKQPDGAPLLYLVRPQGLHLVLAKLIGLVVNKRVPAGTVHVGGLPDAEVTGREAADGRPWNRNRAWRQPGVGAEEWGPGIHQPRAFQGLPPGLCQFPYLAGTFSVPGPGFRGPALPSHHRSVWLRAANVSGL